MKKIKIAFIALMMMGLGAGVVNAQDKAATTTTQTDKKAPAASGQHLKKDGTPDMRYKENKQAAGTSTKASDSKATKSAPKDGGTTKKSKASKTAPATK